MAELDALTVDEANFMIRKVETERSRKRREARQR